MKVHELIKVLQEFEDQEADVFVIEHYSGNSPYDQGGNIKEVIFNKDEHLEYVDFRGNPHIKPDRECFDARTLLIGSRDN